MRAELPVLSFICAIALAIILPFNIRRITGVPNLTIGAGLLICSLIHALNSILWDSLVEIPVWCDIGESLATKCFRVLYSSRFTVTKILLASDVAFPAALFCIFHNLEEVTSTRKIKMDPCSQRNMRIFDATLCILLPILYILLRRSHSLNSQM